MSIRNVVTDYGATGDGVTNDRAAIQAAIDDANAAGGGQVFFPVGQYLVTPPAPGEPGLTVYGNIVLMGEAGRYAGNASGRAVSLIYGGEAAAIFGQNLLDTEIWNLDLDCLAAAGSDVRGFHGNGCWKSILRHVTVRGVTPAKGYSILIDTKPGGQPSQSWGAQHNYLEEVESADGVIRFEGVGGSDGVTTTVCNTIRGSQYEIVSSQIVFINSTAEGFSAGPGFDFSGAGCHGVMLGCDIEGAGSPGVRIAGAAEVRELGTIWGGFTGALRVEGETAPLRSYGGRVLISTALQQGVPKRIFEVADLNADYIAEDIVPTSVVGGTQAGHRRWLRREANALLVDHDWRDHAFLRTTLAVNGVAPVVLFRAPVTNGAGLKLTAHIHGVQLGDGPYSASRECVVQNYLGSLTIAQSAPLTVGINMALEFVSDGAEVLVRATPTTANASQVNATLEIVGPWTTYQNG